MTSASNASLFAVTAPLFIMVISFLFLKERTTLKKSCGIFLAMAGVIVVMNIKPDNGGGLSIHFAGDLLVLASILMWAIFTVMGKSLMTHYGALKLTALITYLGALSMVPPALFEVWFENFSYASIPGAAWLAICFLGVTCSFLATLLYMSALETMESQKVGVYLYTVPVMTYFFAAIFLGEMVTLNLIVGSIMVISGVAVTERA